MKTLKIMMISFLLVFAKSGKAQVIDVVTGVVKRVIKAIDLKVQRMQNKTIWLQNAQKTLENELSKLKLTEISNWSDKQRKLYGDYYSELMKVKSAITYYQRVRTLAMMQVSLVKEYQRAWQLLSGDKHFSAAELNEMQRVYLGILGASARNLDQVMLAINPGKTQMTDQQRLEMISKAGDQLEDTYSDLKQYNNQNKILSLHRSKDQQEINTIKKYYGIH